MTPAGLNAPPKPGVIGLDISLTATGIASNYGWTALVGKPRITALTLTARIRTLDELAEEIVLHTGSPDLVVVEGVSFAGARQIGVLERDALWWQVVKRLHRKAPLAVVAPTARAKYATGKGNAGKAQVVDAVARRYPQFTTHGNDNLCDAIVLAAMGSDWLGHPLVVVPASWRAALDKVAWPEPYTIAAGAVGD